MTNHVRLSAQQVQQGTCGFQRRLLHRVHVEIKHPALEVIRIRNDHRFALSVRVNDTDGGAYRFTPHVNEQPIRFIDGAEIGLNDLVGGRRLPQ